MYRSGPIWCFGITSVKKPKKISLETIFCWLYKTENYIFYLFLFRKVICDPNYDWRDSNFTISRRLKQAYDNCLTWSLRTFYVIPFVDETQKMTHFQILHEHKTNTIMFGGKYLLKKPEKNRRRKSAILQPIWEFGIGNGKMAKTSV